VATDFLESQRPEQLLADNAGEVEDVLGMEAPGRQQIAAVGRLDLRDR
jgi:hypothetical protein